VVVPVLPGKVILAICEEFIGGLGQSVQFSLRKRWHN
jgi:hypothetical protein